MQFIVVEDGLASNAPHLRLLKELGMHFLTGAKPGDHAFLYDRVINAYDQDRVTTLSWREGNVHCELAFVNDLPLNESNQDRMARLSASCISEALCVNPEFFRLAGVYT